MSKKVLIVYAHPEPTSLTSQFVETAVQTLLEQGHEVMLSDLYEMDWKAVFDGRDFPDRANPERLSLLKSQRTPIRLAVKRKTSHWSNRSFLLPMR